MVRKAEAECCKQEEITNEAYSRTRQTQKEKKLSTYRVLGHRRLLYPRVSEQERGSISGILATVEAHANILEVLRVDHSVQSTSIEQKAVDAFQQKYMDYEPTGTTPIRCEPDIPCKGTIESLRAMPMEALLEEFRENHSYESFKVKESKPSLIPRSPLIQLN